MLLKMRNHKSSVVYKKTLFKEMIYDVSHHNDEMLSFFQNVNTHLKEADYFYKNKSGDTTTVGRVKVGQNTYVIKSYNFRNVLHGIKLQFRKSHGFRSFCYTYLLNNLNIPAIKPVAVIQKKLAFFKFKCYLITKYEDGIPGCEYFKNDSANKIGWQNTINSMISITTKLKQNNIYHGDYHFGNFVIVDQQPILLDFDRIRVIKNQKIFRKFHMKDIKNFFRYLKRNSQAYEEFNKHPQNPFKYPHPNPLPQGRERGQKWQGRG